MAVAQAQQRNLDSLVLLEKTYLTEDTIRVSFLTNLARGFYRSNPAKGLEYADKAITLGEKLADKKFLAGAYSAKGTNKFVQADYAVALENYQKALAINTRIGSTQGIANNYNNIGLIYYSVFDYPKALDYYQKTLTLNEQTGNDASLINVLGNIGNIHNELRNYPKAIEYYQKALDLCEKTEKMQALSGLLVNIGNVYTQLADYPKALEYKQKALAISEKQGNKAQIANNLGNIGNVYFKMADYPRALEYHQKALEISQNIQDKQIMAASLAGISAVYQQQQRFTLATDYAQQARELAKSIGLLSTESQTLEQLSQLYESTSRYDSAYWAYRQFVLLRDSIDNVEVQKQITRKTLQFDFSKTEDSLVGQQLLTDAKLKAQILLATKQQQELVLQQNAIDLANKGRALQRLAFLNAQAELLFAQSENKISAEQLARAENEKQLQATQVDLQQSQLELKDKALQAQKTQRYYYLAGLALLALLSFFIFRNYRNQQKSNRLIRLEKKKSDELLLNILPKEVADELKEKGSAAAKQYDEVTVLFTDFVDFTKMAENRSPQQLVNELHDCFKSFDEIIERHGLEKIKTIGDAYMAVSGLPLPDARHARNAALAALDIQQYIRQRQHTQHDGFDIRIGLHSGPVVAGIVGVKKFAYDIWGDTVNTAARMESSSEPGKINVSGATYDLLKNNFSCVYRGKIAAKNKGNIDMYFLTGNGVPVPGV
ncbi:MAG: tetratricopeptide repeat protein [Lewinellaceae bacterium]|nr:tetratricopeptide repeat protein [Lewinellaceae bacterium]